MLLIRMKIASAYLNGYFRRFGPVQLRFNLLIHAPAGEFRSHSGPRS